ncbi:MAG: PaaI family thioesterase [Myxococcales bacterium]|nr:PaaI family thioesterase [Myxococcales bacterium]
MTETDDSLQAYYRRLEDNFHRAPITRHVPQRMEVVGPGEVRITLPPDPRLCHGAARVHGGILSLLLDNAGFFAAATLTGGYWVATTEFNTHLLESVAGEDVVATGRVLRPGRNVFHAEMRARIAAREVAVGFGTYMVLPRKFSA